MAECIVWVAETDRIVGFIAWRSGWVDHLNLDVDATRPRHRTGAA